MPDPMTALQTATLQEIKDGRVTDVYFVRTREVLLAKNADRRVTAEFIVKTLPHNWSWAILAGVEECMALLDGLKVSVRAMPEGTVFQPYQPVMEITGMYSAFCVYETALLGLICQASGIATKAARCKVLAGDRPIVSFGARRMHPVLAPMIDRSAYIGGCDGVAVIKSAEQIGEEPVGTIPHALVLLLGGTTQALRAFHEIVDPKIRRVALVDTFGDERFEAVAAAEALRRDLYAVRLDTPASRRGNLLRILEEVRWELDLRGFRDVKLFVSGGIDEEQIIELNPLTDAYGIGTSISNAPVVDFAMDIVEVEGQPLSKRGKMSGAKQVVRCRQCSKRGVVPVATPPATCECGGQLEGLLSPLIQNGRLVRPLPHPRDIRGYVLAQLAREGAHP